MSPRCRGAACSCAFAARRPTSRAGGTSLRSLPTRPIPASVPPSRSPTGCATARGRPTLPSSAGPAGAPPPPRSFPRGQGAAGAAARPLFCAVSKGGSVTGVGLSDKAVVRLIKQAAAEAGLDPARFAGHSLRAGLATAAGDAGAGLPELMRQTRHKSTEVALGYLRPAELWTNNVSARVFAAAAGPALAED